MRLTDNQLQYFIDRVLRVDLVRGGDYAQPVYEFGNRLKAAIEEGSDSSFKRLDVIGSARNGTQIKAGSGPHVDLALYTAPQEKRHETSPRAYGEPIRRLLRKVYPAGSESDFQEHHRLGGIAFRESATHIVLIPVIPAQGSGLPAGRHGALGWQPTAEGRGWIQTDIAGHIQLIQSLENEDPRFVPLVRLVKCWRNYREIDSLSSYTIEKWAAKVQQEKGPAPDLEEGLTRLFLDIAASVQERPQPSSRDGEGSAVSDQPATYSDSEDLEYNVSDRIDQAELEEIAGQAETAWETIHFASSTGQEEKTLDLWKEVFGRQFAVEETQ